MCCSTFIKKVKSRPVEDEFAFGLVVTSEEDGGREDALETLHDPVVPLTVLEKVEEVEHLGGSVESYNPATLANRERCYPDWNEAILAEGQSELGMTEDLKEELSIASRVKQLVDGRSAEWKSAEHEGASMKSELLLSVCALFLDELDGLDLFQPTFADAEGRRCCQRGVISPVDESTCVRH
jgi:hypothetical protein